MKFKITVEGIKLGDEGSIDKATLEMDVDVTEYIQIVHTIGEVVNKGLEAISTLKSNDLEPQTAPDAEEA